MTEEAQRIAIAKVCGFTTEQQMDEPETWRIHPQVGTRHFYDTEAEAWSVVPDYLHDLNAMHEVEKMLTFDQFHHEYIPQFEHVCLRAKTCVYSATAAQRAEAFLRTKGLWAD